MPVERPHKVELHDVRKTQIEVSDSSLQHWRELRSRVQERENYLLRPDIPDYIRWPFINEWKHPAQIDKIAQGKTATLIGEVFRDINPDYIIAVGHSGLPLGKAVKDEFHRTERRTKYIEVQNLEGIAPVEAVSTGSLFRAHSYSRMGEVSYFLPEVEQGSTAIVIDDVLAQGGLSRGLLAHLQQKGIDVLGMAVYFTKRWQNGIRVVTNDFGVPVFAAVCVDGIANDETIVLAPENEGIVRYEPRKTASDSEMWDFDPIGTKSPVVPKSFISERKKYPTDDIPF